MLNIGYLCWGLPTTNVAKANKKHNHLHNVVVELAENSVISGWSVNNNAVICALALNNHPVHCIQSNISTVER